MKYRANESFSFKNLPEDYPWVNAYFILVSKRHIKCITYEQLKAGEFIGPECFHYLSNRKEFELDKETIVSFCTMAVKFFKGV